MTFKDNCICDHADEWHDIEAGTCAGTKIHPGGFRGPCNCWRYRPRGEVQRAEREERFWARVGRGS